MLVPAIYKKNELEALFAKCLYDEDMFLYNGYPYCNMIPDITPSENIYKWVIIDNNKTIGYFTYYVDAYNNTVRNFGLYSFDRGNYRIGIDVYIKIKELIKTHHRIEWRMIGGNPVERYYDKLCERFGGRKIILFDAVKDQEGHYHNEYIYEIINQDGQ